MVPRVSRGSEDLHCATRTFSSTYPLLIPPLPPSKTDRAIGGKRLSLDHGPADQNIRGHDLLL